MKIGLIICTYQRSESLKKLLDSVRCQKRKPFQVLVIDGSTDKTTEKMISSAAYPSLEYYHVDDANRGLTRQRNYGLSKLSNVVEVASFVDDDTVLFDDYFERMEQVFLSRPDITGLGGVQVNGNRWQPALKEKSYPAPSYYQIGNFVLKEDFRNRIRNILGLSSDELPGILPPFSHGRTCSYPLDTGLYEVDLLVGMSFAFRRSVFSQQLFSTFFEGYGLYEDADYSLRAKVFGKNYVDTHLKLYHYHHPSGRPNQFKYGRMVVRNGWHIWRLKNPKPSFSESLKWHSITLLLAVIRLLNVFQGYGIRQAVSDFFGRITAFLQLPFMQKEAK